MSLSIMIIVLFSQTWQHEFWRFLWGAYAKKAGFSYRGQDLLKNLLSVFTFGVFRPKLRAKLTEI